MYHVEIVSFSSFFSSIANAVALSILYITHPNKHNNQQFNVKAILEKKDSNPCQTLSDLTYIYEFDNAISFKLKSISLFWYLDNFLEKDKSGLLFQINIA